MKKLYIITLLSSLVAFSNNANSQNFRWAKQMGGTDYDHGNSIAVDDSGNVYTTGTFRGTGDFDPGSGTSNLTSAGYSDAFVSKVDSSGNFIWAKQMGGTDNDYGSPIAIDTTNATGGIYLGGTFSGIADFDPGTGTYNLTSADYSDAFVVKLSTSGNFIWAKQMGGTSGADYVSGGSIVLDASGNVYTTGQFGGTVDFDPGAGIYNLTTVNANIFVSKMDASGNFNWAKQMGGASSSHGSSIAVDKNGNVYTTGSFIGTADFDPGSGTYNLTSSGIWDIFVSKLDSSGNFKWAKHLGGTQEDECSSIAFDINGNAYTTGRFRGTADFDPGTGIYNLTSSGIWDIFISKLDSLGNFLWAKQMGGTDFDYGNSIAVDVVGNVYTTGGFIGTSDFNLGGGTFNLTSLSGSWDIFVSKHNSSGNFIWAKQMGGTFDEIGSSIALDASVNVYATGYFSGSCDFDPGTGTFNLTSVGGSDDIFVMKLSDVLNGITENSILLNEINIYPNPSTGQIKITSSRYLDELKITNPRGQIIYQAKHIENNFSLQLATSGIYFIQITTDKQTITKKIIVCK